MDITFDVVGLIDLHVHSAPDLQPRLADDVDVARAATIAGLRAILLKSHDTLTADRAAIAEKVVGGVRVFGGLVLNEAVGGLNPRAVEVALQMGAREIWFPTLDAANHRRLHGQTGGITILAEDGRVRPAVYQILDLLRDADVALGTGHLAIGETAVLVRLARERGLRRIVVTHPEAPFIAMPVALQEELRGEGVFFERCYLNILASPDSEAALAEVAAQIRRVGVGSTVLATDLGQAGNPPPPEGLSRFVGGLLRTGLNERDIRVMAAENPAYLLGL